MASITIGANSYEVYRSLANHLKYLAAEFSATNFRAATTENQSIAIVTATRLLDRLGWAGDKADEDQTKAFPRSGISDLEDDQVPAALLDAESLLASAIIDGQTVVSSPTTGNNIRRQQAGSVSIEYFNPAMITDPTRLPQPVMELIGKWLGGAPLSGVLASGTDGCSILDNGFGLSGSF
jgi:hypothetical protein